MSDGTRPGDFAASITPTNNPQVADFRITISADRRIAVEFGTDTRYGRSTAPVPAPPGS